MFDQFFAAYGVPVLGGALFFGAAWLAARWLSKAAKHILGSRLNLDTTVVELLTRIVSVSVLVLAGIAVLDEIGVEVSSLIAALGIFGFAIAIGMRTTTTNFFTGVMVFILKPYKVGEYIEAERVEGVVESISIFHTVVVTEDGVYAAVPNGQMWARSIRNHSRTRPRRIEIELTVERNKAFSAVRSVIEDTLAAAAVPDPPMLPKIQITDVLENSMTIAVWIWGNAEQVWDLRNQMTERLRQNLTAAGIRVIRAGTPKRKRRVAAKKETPPPAADDEL